MLPYKTVLLTGFNSNEICKDLAALGYECLPFETISQTEGWLVQQISNKRRIPEAILCDLELEDGDAFALFTILQRHNLSSTLFIILSDKGDLDLVKKVHQAGIDELFLLPVEAKTIHFRLQYLSVAKVLAKSYQSEEKATPRIAPFKRAFDIVASATALLLLSPIMLLIAALIKLDSRGPVFYISRRAGFNYKIFNFYKFRTMRVNADQELKQLLDKNQYKDSAFVKISNDPRVTRLGSFLRNTSLDELPQLFNVLRGDMSLVGNRPLPLYEAESLTTDEWAMRFLAPSGITGLWQVTKRGHEDMTDEERKNLDVQYAMQHSAYLDYQILLKTFAALKQKSNV